MALTQILLGVLAANAEAIAQLRELARNGISIPAYMPDAALGGRYRAPEAAVPVYLHYLVGNCDWPLRLPGKWFDQLREVVKLHFGLANRRDFPFPHDPAESPLIGELLHRHRVQARHGDIYDAVNFAGDRNTSSLGDAIVIELINRFTLEVEQDFGTALPPDLLKRLKSIHYVRPVLQTGRWLEAHLENACENGNLHRTIALAWDRLVDRFLESPGVRSCKGWNPVDLIDGLERVLKINSRRAARGHESLANVFGHEQSSGVSLVDCAQAEQESRRREIDYVVYGHGHLAERLPLKGSQIRNGALNKAFFNLGAGQPSASGAASANRPIDVNHAMTGLVFFQGDQCGGRRYAIWSNTPLPASDADTSRADHGKFRRSA